jgi:hypothetical protein
MRAIVHLASGKTKMHVTCDDEKALEEISRYNFWDFKFQGMTLFLSIFKRGGCGSYPQGLSLIR